MKFDTVKELIDLIDGTDVNEVEVESNGTRIKVVRGSGQPVFYGGPGYAPFYVPGDYATRTDITPHPDAVPLDDFTAWRIDPNATASIRADVADLILVLQ